MKTTWNDVLDFIWDMTRLAFWIAIFSLLS
jgi:hypothetical protein